MASWLRDAIFSQRNWSLKKPPKLPQQKERSPAASTSQFKPHTCGRWLKVLQGFASLSSHCSWTLFSSGKATPSFHTWDVKEISHVDTPQGYGVRQIYLKQCKGLNASHLLRLINLGWLGLDLQSWFSYFSSRAERHSWWSQNKAYSWRRFKQMFFSFGICMVHIGYYNWAGTEKLGLWAWWLGGLG